jgi:hypothetical protein
LIENLYDGAAPGFLGRAISGREVHPLGHYMAVADARVRSAVLCGSRLALIVALIHVLGGAAPRAGAGTRRDLLLLALAAGVSVAVRWPHLGRTLGDGERSMAHTLIIHENWDLQGAWKHRFCMLRQYPGDANKFIRSKYTSIDLMDAEGNGYYSSMPPFSIMLPYLLFRPLGIPSTPLTIQVFNMAVQMATVFLFYFLLRLVLGEGPLRNAAALLGAVSYLFYAPNLWYYSNYYCFDSQWQNGWIAVLLCFFALRRRVEEGRGVSRGWLWALGAATFFMVYSEYHGVVMAGTVGLYGLAAARRRRAYAAVLPALALGTAAALALTFAQFSSVSGVRPFIESFLHKGAGRSGYAGGADYDLWLIPLYYATAYSYLLLPLAGLAVLNLLARPRQGLAGGGSSFGLFAFLTVFPVLLHHAALAQWTALHWFSVVKASVFLAGLTAVLFARLAGVSRHRRPLAAAAAALVLNALVTSCGVFAGTYVGEEDPARFYATGRKIARTAAPDETVLAIPARREIVHTLIYYSKRNIQLVESREEALAWLRDHGRGKGVLFHLDAGDRVTRFERLSL